MIETTEKPHVPLAYSLPVKEALLKCGPVKKKYFLRKVESLSQHIIFGNGIH